MKQKKLKGKVSSLLRLYVICAIFTLTMGLVNMNRGFGMELELGEFLNNNLFSQCQSTEFKQYGVDIDKTIRRFLVQQEIRDDSILYEVFMHRFRPIITRITTNYLFLADEDQLKKDSLLFIRKFQELEDNTTTTRPAKYGLIRKINRSIYSSRKLFFSTFAKHLTNQSSQKTHFDDGDQLRLSYNNGITFTLARKQGAQFGGKLSFEDNNDKKQYFVKTSFGYPVFNKENDNYINTIGQMASSRRLTFKSCSQSSHNVISATAKNNVLLLNLKEPFIYKVLEQFNIGAKTDFIINPYIKYGFYIMTENLNENNNSFTEMRKIEHMPIRMNIDTKLGRLFQGEISFDEYKNFSSLISFNEVDIVNRIFTLNDFNTGNFGILNNRNNVDANGWLSLDTNLKIIDFCPSVKFDTRYIVDNIGTSFIEGNSITKYDITSIMYRAVCRKHEEWNNLEPAAINNQQIEEIILKNRQEKFYFGHKALLKLEDRLQQYRLNHRELFNNEEQIGNEQILRTLLQQQSQYIKNLMNEERGENEDEVMLRHPTETIEVNGIKRNRNRTNAELIGFEDGTAPDNVVDPEKRLQYLNSAFEDLDIYCTGIVQNYRDLKNFIDNGYNQYFDENGDLRQRQNH